VLSFNGVLFFIDTIFYLTRDFYTSWAPGLFDGFNGQDYSRFEIISRFNLVFGVF
jgi:hypothetical protein